MKRDRIENAIRHIQTAVDIDPWARDLAVEALKAQLSEEDTTSDCISRQAAIRIASGYCHPANIAKELAKLPSVQPERTCVNCGRTANNGGWYADGGTRCPIEEHYALPKDGYCHLWEKRNVTDDDYPERREDERPES